MPDHPVKKLIYKADDAINRRDFDTLIDIYAEDAVLVVKADVKAVGKAQIRKAFESISEHFEHSLHVRQADMEILEAGDSALVMAKTIISANNHTEEERYAIYAFKKDGQSWRCIIDNSYGHELLK